MRVAERNGFTLIELLAALAIAGIALLGGILLLDQIGDASTRIAAARVTTMRTANGARLLRRLILNALASPDTMQGLQGAPRVVSLRTMCETPQGWPKPCRARLVLDQEGDTSVVIAELPGGPTLRLLAMQGAADFRYVDGAQGTLWMTQWSSGLGLPGAIAIATASDTLVYPLGVMHD